MSNAFSNAPSFFNVSPPGPAATPRRRFLHASAAAALATTLAAPLTRLRAAEKRQPLPFVDTIGLQLYTVREAMAADPAATLTAVAQAGYHQVELMEVSPQGVQVAKLARERGLQVHSGFMDFNVITAPDRDGVETVDEVLRIAKTMELSHVVFGYIAGNQRDTADKCRGIADRANAAADKARGMGLRMCYHNHAFEFEPFGGADPGKKESDAWDIFVRRFDQQAMEFELDVFWAKLAGRNPAALMRRLAGRISQVHLKDIKPGTPVIFDENLVPKDAFEELGDGEIAMPSLMRLAKKIGVDICHVEQDQSPHPIGSIQQSARYLRSRA